MLVDYKVQVNFKEVQSSTCNSILVWYCAYNYSVYVFGN